MNIIDYNKKELDSEHVALSDLQIMDYLQNLGMKETREEVIKTFEELKENPLSLGKYAFIFTGNEPSELNGGYDHHWLLIYGDQFFDSYGFQDSYKLPDYNLKNVKTNPKRLQEYGSAVCGEYCLAFFVYLSKEEFNYIDYGEGFCRAFDLGQNRKRNDEIVLSFYNETKKQNSNNKSSN